MLAAVTAVGIVGNIGQIAFFIGALLALVTDPILIVGAVIIGIVITHQFWLLGSCLIFSAISSIYISITNAELGAELSLYVAFVRFVATVGMAYVANIVRLAATGNVDKAID
jgi:hypothetical protein